MGDRDVRLRIDVEDKFERLAQSMRKAEEQARRLDSTIKQVNANQVQGATQSVRATTQTKVSADQLNDAVQKTGRAAKQAFGEIDKQVLGMSRSVQRTTEDMKKMNAEMDKAKKAGGRSYTLGGFSSNAGAAGFGFFAAGASLAGSQLSGAAGNGISASDQRNRLAGGALSGAGAGAALGFAAAGPVGGVAGGIVGGAAGYIGALEANTKALEENRKAIQDANRRAEFSIGSATLATNFGTRELNLQRFAQQGGQAGIDAQRAALGREYVDNRVTFAGLDVDKRNTNSRSEAADIAQQQLAILQRQRQIEEHLVRLKREEGQLNIAANAQKTAELTTLQRIAQQEANIARAKADAAGKQLQSAAEQFASLTPAEQAERKSLEGRLAKGKQLTPEQLLRARQLGSSIDEIGQQQRQRANERGFLDTVGGARLNEANNKAVKDAEQAEKRLGKVEADLKVSIVAGQDLARELEEQLKPLQAAIIETIRESLLQGFEVSSRQIAVNRQQSLGG